MSDLSLADRVAIVTGAARGQGRAHALALAAAGATVIACDIAADIETVGYPLATAADLAETVRSARAAGGIASAEVMDVRDPRAVDDLTRRVVDRHGRVDILVANAGITGYRALEQISDASWRDMIAVNLTGTFQCVRAVVPHMRSRGFGRIVAVASGAGRSGMAALSHYAASKWGVIGFIKSIALEVAGDGITANIVCPTTVSTPMIHHPDTYARLRPDLATPTVEDVRPAFAAMNPMGVPWLEPSDVTRAVMFFATDPGTTTGAVLEVGLGTSAFRP